MRCVDGSERPYLSLDAAASTSALPAVADRVNEFLPWYSSVHRGAGYRSQVSTAAYEEARAAALSTTTDDIDRFLAAVAIVADGSPAPVAYRQDAATGDYWPEGDAVPWVTGNRSLGASCSRG